MQFTKRVRTTTVSASTDYEFDMQFAHAMQNVEKLHGSLKDIHWLGDKMHCIIIWETSMSIPETPQEEHQVEGSTFQCHECRCYVPSTDGRIKYTRCTHGTKCAKNDSCCEWFYEMLDNCDDILVKSPSVIHLRGVI